MPFAPRLLAVIAACTSLRAAPEQVGAADDLRSGAYDGTRWNASIERLELESAARVGTFTSGVLDAGEGRVFGSLTWRPDVAYAKGLPEPESSERGYPAGNADMRDTLALLRGAPTGPGEPLSVRLERGAPAPDATVLAWLRESERFPEAADAAIRIAWNGRSGRVEAHLVDAAGRERVLSGSPETSGTARAHHVALVLDGTADQAILFVDGRAVDRARIEHAPLAPGARVDVAGLAPAPFGPETGELAVVGRALTQADVEALVRRGLGRVRVQVALCEDPTCADGSFVGPDGTVASYFDEKGPSAAGAPEWSLAPIHAGRLLRYRVTLESADPGSSPEVATVAALSSPAPLVPLADTDGDGVDDAVDCAPLDPTTWAVPSEATDLTLSGNPTAFSWSAAAAPGTTAIRYDVIRAAQPNGFDSGSCVVTNAATTVPGVTDGDVPAPGFSYLVRAKNACGQNLGLDQNGNPRTGVACSSGVGDACTANAECSTGCCSTTCQQLGTVTNCGACGQVCPGETTTSDAFCSSNTCGFTCTGENYDVNGNVADGCEQPDSPVGNHTQATAASLGSLPCTDTSTFSTSGTVPSDGRTHSPAVLGFNTVTGAAPDYMQISATGGLFCVDDLAITLTTAGGAATVCYRLTVQTNIGTWSCQTTGAGSCSVIQGSGSYSDGTTVYLIVEKTCSLSLVQKVSYTVFGHL